MMYPMESDGEMDMDLGSENSFEANVQDHSSPPPPRLNPFAQSTSSSPSRGIDFWIAPLASCFTPYKGKPLPEPNSTIAEVWDSVPNMDYASTTTTFNYELGTDDSIMEGIFKLTTRGRDHVTRMICNLVNSRPRAAVNAVPIFTRGLCSLLSPSESEDFRVCLREGVMRLFSLHWNVETVAPRPRVSHLSADALQASLNVAQLVTILYRMKTPQVLTVHDVHLCITTIANGDRMEERLQGIHTLIMGLDESICERKSQIPHAMHDLRDRLLKKNVSGAFYWGDSPMREQIIRTIDMWFAMAVREKRSQNPSVHLSRSELKWLNRGNHLIRENKL